MSHKYIMFWTMTWALAVVICCVIEGSYVTSQNALVNTLTGYSIFNQTDANIWTYFSLGLNFMVVGVPNLLLFNYSFLQMDTAGQLFRWVLIATLDPALIFLLYTLIFNRGR